MRSGATARTYVLLLLLFVDGLTPQRRTHSTATENAVSVGQPTAGSGKVDSGYDPSDGDTDVDGFISFQGCFDGPDDPPAYP